MAIPQAPTSGAPRPPKPEGTRIAIASTPKHLSIDVPHPRLRQVPKLPVIILGFASATCLAGGVITFSALFRHGVGVPERVFMGIYAVASSGFAALAVGFILCMTLLGERLEVEAQGGRYRLTRELHGLQGWVGQWIVRCCEGGCVHEGEAAQLWGLQVHTWYSETDETVGPAQAHLYWTESGKRIKFACGEYEGFNVLTEREWVVGEVQSFLEQHEVDDNHTPLRSSAGGMHSDVAIAPQAPAASGALKPPRPEGARITITSTPKRLSIDCPPNHFRDAQEYVGGYALLAISSLGVGLLASWIWLRPYVRPGPGPVLTPGLIAAYVVWGMMCLAFYRVCLGAVCNALCVALLGERLEVDSQAGRYRLTRELRGMNGGVGEWIVHHFRGGRLHEGEASRLLGMAVAKAYSDGQGLSGKTACSASLHWTAGGELVRFGSRLTRRDIVLVEEKEWVVGEVLAWLEQGLEGRLP